MKKFKKQDALYILLGAVLLAGIVFSGFKLYGIFADYHKSNTIYDAAAAQYTARRVTESAAPKEEELEDETPKMDESGVFWKVSNVCDFSVDFENLWQTNGEIVAWIHAPDTVIDYPVLHGETNETYLHTTWDGTYAAAGSIFINYRMRGDLTDYSTIVYGHNMKSGAMFHALKSYTDPDYYTDHPYIWYVTPGGYYLLYVIAGYQTDTSDIAYEDKLSEEDVRDYIAIARGWSWFEADYVVDGLDADTIAETANRVVILSTCSTASDDARYVIVTVPLLAN